MRRPARPARASSTLCRVSLVPTPATTWARSPTASSTARTSCAFSASLVVGDSPVVPLTTRPSLPASTRWVASRCAPSRSSAPSAVNGVTMAVRTRPKGVCGVEVGAMGNTLLVAHGRGLPSGDAKVVTKRSPALPARGFKQCRVRLIRLDELLEMPQYGHFARMIRTSVSVGTGSLTGRHGRWR